MVSCKLHMQTLKLHYVKRLLAPFCFSSIRDQIPFCSLPKGNSYRMQNHKNQRKKSIACSSRIPSFSLQKSRWLLRAIAKGYKTPFRANCMQNLPIACNSDNVNVAIYIPLGDLNLKFKKWRQVLKFCLSSTVFFTHESLHVQPYHFQAGLIRYDGAFKCTCRYVQY